MIIVPLKNLHSINATNIPIKASNFMDRFSIEMNSKKINGYDILGIYKLKQQSFILVFALK